MCVAADASATVSAAISRGLRDDLLCSKSVLWRTCFSHGFWEHKACSIALLRILAMLGRSAMIVQIRFRTWQPKVVETRSAGTGCDLRHSPVFTSSGRERCGASVSTCKKAQRNRSTTVFNLWGTQIRTVHFVPRQQKNHPKTRTVFRLFLLRLRALLMVVCSSRDGVERLSGTISTSKDFSVRVAGLVEQP